MKTIVNLVAITCVASILLSGCNKKSANTKSNSKTQQQQTAQKDKKLPPPTIDIWDAAAKGNTEQIKRHFDFGTTIDATFVAAGVPGSGGSALHLAAINNRKEVVKLLIEKGANLNVKANNQDGSTPLQWAVIGGNLEIVKMLIDAGAKINDKDTKGFTALDATLYEPEKAKEAKLKIAEYLRSKGAKGASAGAVVTPPAIDIWKAAAEGKIDAVKQHIAAGTNINGTFVLAGVPGSGGTPLHLAVMTQQKEIIELLVEKDANLDAKADDEHRGTPLHWAVVVGSLEIIEQLIDVGANVNSKDKNGYTPLDAVGVNPAIPQETKDKISKLLKVKGAKTREELSNQK